MSFSLRGLTQRASLAVVASAFTLAGCAQERSTTSLGCDRSAVPCLNDSAQIALETEKGTVVLQLDGKHAPLTAGNFVDLVKRGIYNGTLFHRVVRSPMPFVVQGGDPATADPKTPVSAYGTGNFIDPTTGEGRFIPLEFKLKPSDELLYGQELGPAFLPRKPALLHDRGVVAMARSADPNSASSQFYITLKPLPELDGRYAVFGRVIQGMDVVDRLQQGDKLVRARLLTAR